MEICSLSACFGCLPITSFGQNVGLLAMTKVITAIIMNIILPKDMEVSYGKKVRGCKNIFCILVFSDGDDGGNDDVYLHCEYDSPHCRISHMIFLFLRLCELSQREIVLFLLSL